MDSSERQGSSFRGNNSPTSATKNATTIEEISQVNETGIVIELAAVPAVKHTIGPVAMIALAFNTCNSWAGVSASLQTAMIEGGPVALVYGMLISTFVYLCIALVMGELISVYPTAGGQYHFTSILAPKKYHDLLAYICGFINVVTWLAIAASTSFIIVYSMITMASAHHPTFVFKDWHFVLIYIAFNTLAAIYNIFLNKKLEKIHEAGFIFCIVMFLGTFVAIVVRSSPKASGDFVWTSFLNYTGWSDGVCFMISLSNTCYLFGGLDASMHLAEETTAPRRTVPRALVFAVVMGFITAFMTIIADLYSMSDVEFIIDAEGYVAFYVWYQALRSLKGATIVGILGVIIGWVMMTAILQTSSRLTWAFARDNALFWSSKLSRISPTFDAPVYALILNWFVVSVFGFLYLASSTAFTAILNSSVTLAQVSYLIPAALLLYRKRSEKYLPVNRAFRVHKTVGWIVNICAVALTIILSIFFLFPVYRHSTASNFNYNIVVLGIALVVAVLNWYAHARKHFHGPEIQYHD